MEGTCSCPVRVAMGTAVKAKAMVAMAKAKVAKVMVVEEGMEVQSNTVQKS